MVAWVGPDKLESAIPRMNGLLRPLARGWAEARLATIGDDIAAPPAWRRNVAALDDLHAARIGL